MYQLLRRIAKNAKRRVPSFRRTQCAAPPTEEELLAALPRQPIDTAHLGTITPDWVEATLACEQTTQEWMADARRIASLNMPEMTGGCNAGDTRALYYLVRKLRPQQLLEIGTHIGSSTVSMALAIERNRKEGVHSQLTTVDICDVNDASLQPWRKYQSPSSPRELLKQVGCENLVTFEIHPALTKLEQTTATYDLIFLDGDHSATAVYREVPLALQRLRPGGVIVLHDFFPDGRPLWKERPPLVGPWLAIRRLRSEGGKFQALPLGELPWPTKLGSRMTSLALLSRA